MTQATDRPGDAERAATTDKDAAERAAIEDAPELPAAKPGRAAQIAALHMAADWIVLHEAPTPTDMKMNFVVGLADEPDATTRLAGLLAFAEAHGAELYEGDSWAWARLDLAAVGTHGVRIEYLYFIEKTRGAGKVLP
jgi:hypothetical protein